MKYSENTYTTQCKKLECLCKKHKEVFHRFISSKSTLYRTLCAERNNELVNLVKNRL